MLPVPLLRAMASREMYSLTKPADDQSHTVGVGNRAWEPGWIVNTSTFYSQQNKDAGESDSEKEQEEMNELENLLKKHDPSFAKYVSVVRPSFPCPLTSTSPPHSPPTPHPHALTDSRHRGVADIYIYDVTSVAQRSSP